MTRQGFERLRSHGFRPVGPWVVHVGRWSEVTYLFQFESLAQGERLLARFAATAEGRTFGRQVNEFAQEITTRLLIPAPFRHPPTSGETTPKTAATAPPLPHREQIVPGVHVAGFSDRFGSANCGWIALGEETLLIDMPRGFPARFLSLLAATTGKAARRLVLTHVQPGDVPIIRSLLDAGITRVLASPEARSRLVATPGIIDPACCTPCPIERRWETNHCRSSFSRSMQPPAEPVQWFTFRVARCSSPGRWSSTVRAASYPAATQRPGSPRFAGWRSSGPSTSFPASAHGAARSRSFASVGSSRSCDVRSATRFPRAGPGRSPGTDSHSLR